MKSIIRKFDQLNMDERRLYESMFGQALRAGQQLVIHMVEMDVEPDDDTKRSALEQAVAIANEGRAAAAAQGIGTEEADTIIEEAIKDSRQQNR